MAAPMKWYRDGGEGMVSSAKIAGIEITAGVGDEHAVRAMLVSTSDMLGHAEQRAEQALREMHDALVEHLAPVLRWDDIHPSLSTARLGEWMIDVTNGGWYLFVLCEDGRRLVRHAVTIEQGLSHAERKRAAENALRALGVPFRMEGES